MKRKEKIVKGVGEEKSEKKWNEDYHRKKGKVKRESEEWKEKCKRIGSQIGRLE